MVTIIFNILLILFVILTFYNFRWGYLLYLCVKIAIPSFVRFYVGGLSVNFFDILLLGVFLSFIIHKGQISFKSSYKINKILLIYLLSTFGLIFCSSAVVPYSYQLLVFFKKILFQEILVFVMGYYAFKDVHVKKYIILILLVSMICGIYGIFTYFIHHNPYVNLLSLAYTADVNIYEMFQNEVRGALEGRISGTLPHPLAWGQMWTILVGATLLFSKDLNRFFKITLIIIGFTNCLLCGSRTSIIAFCSLFIFNLLNLNIKNKIKFGIVILICSLFLGIVNENKQTNGIMSYISASLAFWDQKRSDDIGIQGSSTSMRKSQFEESLNIANENPIGGVGLDFEFFSIEHPQFRNEKLIGYESIIFKKIVEQGFCGLIFFFVIYMMLYKYSKINIKDKSDKPIIMGYFVSYFVSIMMTNNQGSSWILFVSIILLYDSYKCNVVSKINNNEENNVGVRNTTRSY